MITSHAANAAGKAALGVLLLEAYMADPRDQLISPVGNHAYSTLFSLIPSALAVLRVAAGLEADPAEVLNWYRKVPITELGNLTAERLVSMGRAETVIEFLRSISIRECD